MRPAAAAAQAAAAQAAAAAVATHLPEQSPAVLSASDCEEPVAEQNQAPHQYQLNRLGGRPLSIHNIKEIEAMSFISVFPTGENHYEVARDVGLDNYINIRTRILSSDPRCQEAGYVSYWMITTPTAGGQHLQLEGSVKTACRFAGGAPSVKDV